MLSYILSRIGYSVLVLVGILSVVFFIFNILPVDPARMTMGQRSDLQSLEAVRSELGLDKPLWQQFTLFVNDVSPVSIHANTEENKTKYNYIPVIPLGGNDILVLKTPYLRRSYQTQKEVTTLLMETIPNTLILATGAMIFATIVGIALGVLAAINKGGWIDRLSVSISIIGISTPSFFAGIIIAWVFGFVLSQYTGLNMSGSLNDYDPFIGEVWVLKNLWLPLLTLGLRPLAIIVQLTRGSMLEILTMDYVRTARAKGLNERQVIIKHALRNAVNPVLTAISGWFASLIAGSFFVEYIFGFNGLGKITVEALELSDFPVIMGAILFCGFIFLLINIIVDLLYGILDPRVRLK